MKWKKEKKEKKKSSFAHNTCIYPDDHCKKNVRVREKEISSFSIGTPSTVGSSSSKQTARLNAFIYFLVSGCPRRRTHSRL